MNLDLSDFKFETTEHAEFSPIPKGEYIACVKEVEMKPNSKGTGTLMTLTWQLLEAPHKNRLIWQTLNYHHQKPQVQSIARSQLTEVAKAMGLDQLTSPEQLYNRPVTVLLEIETYNGKDQSRVKKVMPSGEVGSNPVAPEPAPVSQDTAPW
jgi:hypothetical protein